MNFLTAAEDASLFTDVVLSALDNVVHTDGEESAFVRALTTLDLDTLSKFCSHKFGALLAQPARPADLAGLKDEVLAAAGAGSPLTDNATLGRLVFRVVDGCASLWVEKKARHSSIASGAMPPGSAAAAAPVRLSEEETKRRECATKNMKQRTIPMLTLRLQMRRRKNRS